MKLGHDKFQIILMIDTDVKAFSMVILNAIIKMALSSARGISAPPPLPPLPIYLNIVLYLRLKNGLRSSEGGSKGKVPTPSNSMLTK